MARLPNFTRGTRGKDESRSSVREVLTSKPRAVIKPNFSLGHYDLSRQESNYNIAAPSGRGFSGMTISFLVGETNLAYYNGSLLSVSDPERNICVFEFNSSSTSETGEKIGSNSDRITIGISGLSNQAQIARKIFDTFGASIARGNQGKIGLTMAAVDGTSNFTITITTLPPYVGSSSTPPYTNYGWFAATYNGVRGLTDQSSTEGASDGETIQPPFSLSSKILRGSW